MSPATKFKRTGGRYKANTVYRYLVGRGVEQVSRDVGRGSWVETPEWQLMVTGLFLHGNKRPGQVLSEMAREKPLRPALVRLVDPEVEQGMVTIWLADYADLLVRAQR